ncbi:MAG: hypothetical protein PQJ49_10990 [Sphaerochaetaceae bacterium]|jgi:DNA repair photolyase|nr:hypothetical protein [Sphaerochaetaceae bacterium]
MKKKDLKFGTKEWAPHNFNFMNGCSNDCVYCYAKEMSIRFKRKTPDTWKEEEKVSLKGKSFNKKEGNIMFPSSHDITPGNINLALDLMEKLINSGNTLLVVTKPHFSCIKAIINKFETKTDNIFFRFTIGSSQNTVLHLWEPNAPSFNERFSSLKLAYDKGFSTSISCEPLLDNKFDILYQIIEPYVTDSIWIGKMNMASRRVKINTNSTFPIEKIEELTNWQCDKNIIELYVKYNNNLKIKWKESIKKVAIENGLL